jgi:chemotaxis protein histidine kinase CheA
MNATGCPRAGFLEFLEAQRADYRSGVAEKVERMVALWKVIAGGDGDAGHLIELERQAHSLAGSGATFGLRDLGAGARALEVAVHPLIQSGGSPNDVQRVEIDAAILALVLRVPSAMEETGGRKAC